MLFKQYEQFYLSPAEKDYWLKRLPNLTEKMDFKDTLSWFGDLIEYWGNDPVSRNVLLLNNMKKAILARGVDLMQYFHATTGTALVKEKNLHPLFHPANKFSENFQIFTPRWLALIDWTQGNNQEDAFTVNRKSKGVRLKYVKFPSIRIKVEKEFTDSVIVFKTLKGHNFSYPVRVGVFYDTSFRKLNCKIVSEAATLIPTIQGNDKHIYYLDLKRKGSWKVVKRQKIVSGKSTVDLLLSAVSVGRWGDGNKLCARGGQKGVCRFKRMNYKIYEQGNSKRRIPQIIISPTSTMKRMSSSLIREMLASFKNPCNVVFNGKKKVGEGTAGYVRVFPINFLPEDKVYAATKCLRDKISGQPMKGSARAGGLKIGPMEVRNCLQVLQLSKTANEMLYLRSDTVECNNASVSQCFNLCRENAKTLYVDIQPKFKSLITLPKI